MDRLRKLVTRFSCASAQREDGEESSKSKSSSTRVSKKKKVDKKPFTDMYDKKSQAPDPNNKSGLVVREVFLLKQSWKAIMRNEEDFGIDMFMRLFKNNAELKSLFQKFRNIDSDDELRSNEALEFHATVVMTTLDEAITHIDNYDFVFQLLTKTGASHQRFQGFEPSKFLNIKQPFLDAVKVTLGDRYTENMENIYTIAITFILKTMYEGLEEELNKAKGSSVDAESKS